MAFVCELGSGRSLYLDNLEGKTIVTLSSTNPGQQQQASSTFQTGDWTATPEVYLTSDGAVVKLQAAQGHYIRIHGSSIGVSEALSLDALQQMQMQQTSGLRVAQPMQPMEPMQPMKPMQPMQPMESMQPMNLGDMQMSHNSQNPMEMRMGNMQMRMGSTPAAEATSNTQRSAVRQFCSQCGASVQPIDRFCSNCGQQLS